MIVKDNSVRLMRELVGNDLLRISLWKKRGATAPKSVVGHGQVEDQAPAVRCVLEVVADLHVAAPLACACRYAVLRADRVSGRANNGPSAPTIQSFALVPRGEPHGPWLNVTVSSRFDMMTSHVTAGPTSPRQNCLGSGRKSTSMRGSASTTVLLLCLTLVGRSVSQESYSGETCSAEQDG